MSRLFFVLACLAMFTTTLPQASVRIPSAQVHVYMADGPIPPPDGDPPDNGGAFQA